MRSTVRRLALLLAAIPLLVPPTAAAVSRPWPVAPDGARVGDAANTAVIALQKVVGGLSKPVFATHAGDGSGRLFIVEKVGRIRVVRNGSLLATPFLSITSSVSTGSEQGLLGLAFHPSFETNRKLYVDYTDRNGDTVIREYRTFAGNPDAVDKSTGRTVLRIDQPYSNHNGGTLAFGRDGYLYIGMGDGGSAGDPGNRAQSTSSLLGKILRINVNGSTSTRGYLIPSTNPYVGRTGRDEIWSRGLRNPWRFSFDRATGNLWIGDVGQAKWEEIDRSTRVSSGAGRGANYGWRVMEGRHCYRPSTGCNTSGKHLPVVEYQHLSGRCAVTGGYVYRGSAVPGLYGGYVYGDYCTGEIWIVNSTASSPATGTRRLNTALLISSFGEDEAGELYVCDLNGSVYRVVGG